MQAIRKFLVEQWPQLLIPLGVLAATVVAGLLVKVLLVYGLRRWAVRSETNLDDVVIDAADRPFVFWSVLLGTYLGAYFGGWPPALVEWTSQGSLILLVLSLTLVGFRLADGLVQYYGEDMRGPLPVTSLTRTLAQVAVLIVGLLVLLNVLSVSVMPLVTALGVGGLAVALGLQDTLKNFFAGFYVSLARQVRLGDYIKLDSGDEGYVTDIGWRSLSLRTLGNNLIIIPNAKLAEAIVTNYHLPEPRMSLLISVSVSYGTDPSRVESILTEEALQGVGAIPGLLGEPAPFVRFIPGFGNSSLDFTLICQVATFVDQYAVQHELRKRILQRFRSEGIEIPFPVQTVYLRDSGTAPGGPGPP